MNTDFIKITSLYAAGVIIFFYLVWSLLGLALPEANLDLVRALSTSFGINLPDNLMVETKMGVKALAVVVIISVLSIGLIVLNVFFGAIITSRFIHPRIRFPTSSRGVLSTKWNAALPYVLVRMSNFHKADLVDIRLSAMLIVEETLGEWGNSEQFLCNLPISEFSPQRILVMAPKMPWSIAVPADMKLSNSLTKDYHFKPGEKIISSFVAGKKLNSVKRTLQILVQGTDTQSYSTFVIHRKIPIDEQKGDQYTLHLHKGSFKSLPLHIFDEKELEQYAD